MNRNPKHAFEIPAAWLAEIWSCNHLVIAGDWRFGQNWHSINVVFLVGVSFEISASFSVAFLPNAFAANAFEIIKSKNVIFIEMNSRLLIFEPW